MIEIEVPDFGNVHLESLVMDFNGTLAVDGQLLEGVPERLRAVSEFLSLYVITADTFGTVKAQLGDLPVSVQILRAGENQAAEKAAFVRHLGKSETAAIGNGRNDRLMLAEAGVGVAVILREGAAPETVAAADIVSCDICGALELFLNPMRLKATLRS
ncbi:MAG: HAD hydrolase family protein [Acidobacteria bacterium]|nr:HAD hydrolase family protein [Acidobacteriota bacterium]